MGNPPFLGGKRVSTSCGDEYRDWLVTLHAEASSNADLVAHFFRRSLEKLRLDGTFGLIATNTIAQGDTRVTGLQYICTHGGKIYRARRRVKWPGMAAVTVCVVHVAKGRGPARLLLDERDVGLITAFLFHDGGHAKPVALPEHANQCFHGSIIIGSGFLFQDAASEGTPLREMERLVRVDGRNREVIRAYIGGEDLNVSPRQDPSRFVIDFGQL